MRGAQFTASSPSIHSFPSRCAPEASPAGEVSRLVVTEGAHKTNRASRGCDSLLAPTGASHHLPRRGGYGKRRHECVFECNPNDAVRRRRRTLPLARIQKPIFIGCASISRCRGRRPRRPAPWFPRRSARPYARSAIHGGVAVHSFVPITPRPARHIASAEGGYIASAERSYRAEGISRPQGISRRRHIAPAKRRQVFYRPRTKTGKKLAKAARRGAFCAFCPAKRRWSIYTNT